MKKICFFTLSLFFLCAPGAAQRRACDYGSTICEAYAEAGAIFIGEVSKVVPATTNIWQTEDDYDQTAYVKVRKVFKGAQGSSIVLRQLGRRHTRKFIPGETYLFFADYVPALKLWEVRPCGRTRIAKYAQADLSYLNGRSRYAGRTRLAGEVVRYVEADAETAAGRLPGVKLKIVGADREYETVTDANGFYEVYDLPPGKYTVRPAVPDGLVFLWALHSGRDPVARAKSLEIELREGDCTDLDIILTPDKK